MPIKHKKVTVNRKFLTKLADTIYNPKTKKFLRLCDGKLQNGPDPTNKKRSMHCGLGELYVAMTGVEPAHTGVCEDNVVNLAVELSPFASAKDALDKEMTELGKKTKSGIKKLGLPSDLTETLVEQAESMLADHRSDRENVLTETEECFREVLGNIPDANDDGRGDNGMCSVSMFRKRSQRVAAKLREAAEYLPR